MIFSHMLSFPRCEITAFLQTGKRKNPFGRRSGPDGALPFAHAKMPARKPIRCPVWTAGTFRRTVWLQA